MKKILFMAAMFAATVCNAQVVLWNGEDKDIDTDGGFWNRADPTVVDDNGNKCLKVTLKANPGVGIKSIIMLPCPLAMLISRACVVSHSASRWPRSIM